MPRSAVRDARRLCAIGGAASSGWSPAAAVGDLLPTNARSLDSVSDRAILGALWIETWRYGQCLVPPVWFGIVRWQRDRRFPIRLDRCSLTAVTHPVMRTIPSTV
jgi:hypothetical protein